MNSFSYLRFPVVDISDAHAEYSKDNPTSWGYENKVTYELDKNTRVFSFITVQFVIDEKQNHSF